MDNFSIIKNNKFFTICIMSIVTCIVKCIKYNLFGILRLALQ